MARATPPRRSVRTAVVWDALAPLVARPPTQRTPRTPQTQRTPRTPQTPDAPPTPLTPAAALTVVDLGGGTGGFAVPLAELGHDVTVVDESADALAILERRASEHGVRVRAVQGDATDLAAIIGAGRADLVLCHSVLEYVDDPAAALAAVREVLRPGGSASVLAANRTANVVHRALAGRFAEARRVLDDKDGRSDADDQVARRFTLDTLTTLLRQVDLVPGAVHGVRVFADLVPGDPAPGVDGESGGGEALLALEQAAAVDPELRAVATQLHVLATRP